MKGIKYKFFWFLRALLYGPFMGAVKLPGYIGKPIFMIGMKNISIDKRFRIFPGARIEVADNAKLVIKEDVAIAQNVHITCGMSILLSRGVCIAANVCITDTVHNYEDHTVNVLKQKDDYKETIIGDNTFIGYGAVIDAGTILGRNCVVGANSYVKGRYKDYSVLAGNPARVIKYYDPALNSWVNK